MNIDKIVDCLSIDVLRNLIKDECNENFNCRLINALNLLDKDKSLIKDRELYKTYRYIDDKIDELLDIKYDLDAFDDNCFSLECLLNNLSKDIKEERYEYAINVLCHMLEKIGKALKYINDGLFSVTDILFPMVEDMYSKTRDNRLLESLIVCMGVNRYKELKASYLLKFLDKDNAKFIRECVKQQALAIDSKVLDKLFSFDCSVDDKIYMYMECLSLENYIKCLVLLFNEKRLMDFDKVYFQNKDIYELEIKSSKIYVTYYTLLYNRFYGNDNKRALDSLRRLIRLRFNSDEYEKSLMLSTEAEEIEFYKGINVRILCDIYLYRKKYDMFRLILIRNKRDKLYDYYLDDYGKMFKDEYFRYYKNSILEKLVIAKGTNAYHEIALIAMKLLKLDLEGKELHDLAVYIRKTYGSKRSLMEELRNFFKYCD